MSIYICIYIYESIYFLALSLSLFFSLSVSLSLSKTLTHTHTTVYFAIFNSLDPCCFFGKLVNRFLSLNGAAAVSQKPSKSLLKSEGKSVMWVKENSAPPPSLSKVNPSEYDIFWYVEWNINFVKAAHLYNLCHHSSVRPSLITPAAWSACVGIFDLVQKLLSTKTTDESKLLPPIYIYTSQIKILIYTMKYVHLYFWMNFNWSMGVPCVLCCSLIGWGPLRIGAISAKIRQIRLWKR